MEDPESRREMPRIDAFLRLKVLTGLTTDSHSSETPLEVPLIPFLTGQTAPWIHTLYSQEQLLLTGGSGDSQRKLERMELFVCCCF